MIVRHWTGLVKRDRADEYVSHLHTETFPSLTKIPGFLAARILRRSVSQGVEFVIVTEWDSLQAIERFAGSDAEQAVVPEAVQQMMVDYDRTVRHYEVIE